MTDLIQRLRDFCKSRLTAYRIRLMAAAAAAALEAKDREMAALREQYEQLQARCFDSGGSQSVFDRCAELERDNAALRADAERYRAIRYHACKPGWGGASFTGGTPEQCDMATDELVVKMNAALAPAKEQP